MVIKLKDLTRRIYAVVIPQNEWKEFLVTFEEKADSVPDSNLDIHYDSAQEVIDSMLEVLYSSGVTNLKTIDKNLLLNH